MTKKISVPQVLDSSVRFSQEKMQYFHLRQSVHYLGLTFKMVVFRFADFLQFVSQQHILPYEAGQSSVAVVEPPSVVQYR